MIDKMIQEYIRKYTEEKESLVAKYLSETGHKPSDLCLVERETENGRIFYPDLKSNHPKAGAE